MTLQTTADRPQTRLLKTKMFVEQLIVKRKNNDPCAWDAPIAQGKPLDTSINEWVDKTGNEIVTVTPPSMFMQWMDANRTVRLVIASVMVTYVPALAPPTALIKESSNERTD